MTMIKRAHPTSGGKLVSGFHQPRSAFTLTKSKHEADAAALTLVNGTVAAFCTRLDLLVRSATRKSCRQADHSKPVQPNAAKTPFRKRDNLPFEPEDVA